MMPLWLAYVTLGIGLCASVLLLRFAYLLWKLGRKRILADHDPNTPFTADELHRIGIIPPEHYDEWVQDFPHR